VQNAYQQLRDNHRPVTNLYQALIKEAVTALQKL
jgi:hypothetical protein